MFNKVAECQIFDGRIIVKTKFSSLGMGWRPDSPDSRDYTIDHSEVRPWLDKIRVFSKKSGLPTSWDLRDENLSPSLLDQGTLNSCCAFAVMDYVQFLDRKFLGRTTDCSKLFLYQLAERTEYNAKHYHYGEPGSSVSLRSTIKTVIRFGSPPEQFWPYDLQNYRQTPNDPFLFAFAREFGSLRYFRPFRKVHKKNERLESIKQLLVTGLPCICGFSVPQTVTTSPWIPVPDSRTAVLGGQAVLILGYDDSVNSKSTRSRTKKNYEGSFLIRGNWGETWGDYGYGWLPYRYIKNSFATSFWSMLKPEWSNTTN